MKLSERIRPDVEAAPWVIEEIVKLEKDIDTEKLAALAWARKFHAAEQQRDELEQLAASRLEQMTADRRAYLNVCRQRDDLMESLKLCKKHMQGDKWDDLFLDGAIAIAKEQK